jgi:hypothetical protein
MVVQNKFTKTEPKSLYDFFLSGSKVFPRVHPLFTAGDGATSHIECYYRFVVGPDAYQGSESSPMALFSNLPTNHLLTLRMDVPEPSDVQQTQSIQDTDNLRCDLQSGCGDDDCSMVSEPGEDLRGRKHITRVEYGLRNSLVFYGQCYEPRGEPPNGLQWSLTKSFNRGLAIPSSSAQKVVVDADGSTTVGGIDLLCRPNRRRKG